MPAKFAQKGICPDCGREIESHSWDRLDETFDLEEYACEYCGTQFSEYIGHEVAHQQYGPEDHDDENTLISRRWSLMDDGEDLLDIIQVLLKTLDSIGYTPAPDSGTDKAMAAARRVIDAYGPFTATQFKDISHAEPPVHP